MTARPQVHRVNERRVGRDPRELSKALKLVASLPQGIAERELMRSLPGITMSTVTRCIATGWVEKSPIHDRWLRWAQPFGPFPEAAAWVRLRKRAAYALAHAHAQSGLPVTLHVLVPEGHAVIERYPAGDVHVIAAETVRYAHPRSLASGITSKVFLAAISERTHGVLPKAMPGVVTESELESIREHGYGYALTAPPTTDAVLSAIVATPNRLPTCALCTFGPAEILTEARGSDIGPELARLAAKLADASRDDAPILEAATRAALSASLSNDKKLR